MNTKHVVKNVLVAGGAGAVGLFAGGYANQKSETLQKQPYAVPVLLLIVGAVALAKGKSDVVRVAGLGVAGGGGVLALMQYQAQKMAQQSQTAGYGDAGRFRRPGGPHRETGSLQGARAKGILAQQETMGVGDAGALAGRGRRAVIDAQGLSDI